MKFAIFGQTVSSSWGNGHATLWRGLISALTRHGHEVVFFERDVAYYAENRDLYELGSGARLVLFPDWASIADIAKAEVGLSDVAIVTSYCPDGAVASDLVLAEAPELAVYYDLDTPVTLARLQAGETVPYLPAYGLGDFDLVLSYTGGEALKELSRKLGARRTAPLYGHVDPAGYRPMSPIEAFRADLSYIGTFAADRQTQLERLFIEPARLRPMMRFVLAGACYPQEFPWTRNIFFVRHLPPHEHPRFYSSSRLTLNVTRRDMAAMGFCPPGRLFEAAACGVPVLSDWWPGLDSFFEPGKEIFIAHSSADALTTLHLEPEPLRRVGVAARARVLAEHTSEHRARQLVALLQDLPESLPVVTGAECVREITAAGE
jgi:spore maturation protein CgeB